MNNPITRAKTCPNYYTPMKLGSQARVCLSEDYELGQQFALPFGGFFSCKSGNKLAVDSTSDFLNNPRDWLMKCPDGFTQHLALTDNNCRVNFCTKAGVLQRAVDLEIVLPPFEPRPAMKENSTMDMFEGVDPNSSEGNYAFGSGANPPGHSHLRSDNTSEVGSAPAKAKKSSTAFHRGGTAGVALSVLVAVCMIAKF